MHSDVFLFFFFIDYNNSGHGCVEICSWCLRSNKSKLFESCSGFNYIDVATISLIESPSSSRTTSPTVEDVESLQITSHSDGLWMNLYSGTSSKYVNANDTNYTQNISDVSHTGDYARIMLLEDTGGICKLLPITASPATYSYNFVNTTSDGSIKKLGVSCDCVNIYNAWSNCGYDGDSITFGECDAVGESFHVMFLGYKKSSSTVIGTKTSSGTGTGTSTGTDTEIDTTTDDPGNTNDNYDFYSPCIDGNYVSLSLSDANGLYVIWITYNDTTCNLSAVLTASTIETIITNENENENAMIFNGDRLWNTQTQTIHQQLNSNDKIGLTGVGLREFNNIACVFGSVLCETEFYYDVNNKFDDYYDL